MQIKILIRAVTLSFMAVLSTSCATIVGDNSRSVVVQSNPQGAKIYLDNVEIGMTPTNITLNTYIYKKTEIVLKKENYSDSYVIFNSRFQPCALWDLILWPGIIVDAVTGSFVSLDPDQRNLMVNLAQKSEKK